MTKPVMSLASRWAPFGVVAIIWLAVASQQITLPGVYMDAVNPDYLVVRLLNRHAEPIVPWLLSGNDLFGTAPVLISFYHGSQQVWLGLPFFALFGMTVTGLRLTHAMFALAILVSLHMVLVRGGLKPWQAALAGAALALDPAFSYAFRTQSYITLAPTAWLFVALYAMQRAAASGAQTRKWLFASGIFHGLAIVGYFIYAFYLPAMALAVCLWHRQGLSGPRRPDLRPALLWWCAGVALGGIFYPIGYGLFIVAAGSLAEALRIFQQMQQSLHPFEAPIPLSDRIAHIGTMVRAAFSNWFHHKLIFDEYAPQFGSQAKIFLLTALPFALWLYAEWRRRASTLLRVLIALPISYAAVALIFGSRLQGHHFIPLLPLAYAALAVAMKETVAANSLRRPANASAALVFAGLAALNVVGQVAEAQRLAETRGVGYFSDAINTLAADLYAMDRKPLVYFPDWGLSMPVAFLNRGTLAMDGVPDIAAIRHTLCDGRDVAIAVITDDRTARIEAWRSELGWNAPSVVPYAQADGKVLFELATFNGRRDAPTCVDTR